MLKDAKKPPLKLGERPKGVCSRLVSSEGLVFVVNMVLPTPSYYVSAAIYRPRQLAGHQGLRRGQLVGPRGG